MMQLWVRCLGLAISPHADPAPSVASASATSASAAASAAAAAYAAAAAAARPRPDAPTGLPRFTSTFDPLT